MKKAFGIVVLTLLVVAVPSAIAGAIKVWSTGETLSPTDLNANFAHLHAAVGHAHGAVITNADIKSSAAIAHSKMATPGLLPKAWASIGGTVACASSPCTITRQWPASYFSSVTRSATGLYVVNITSSRPNTSYLVMLTPISNVFGVRCAVNDLGATSFYVYCFGDTGAVANDAAFNIVLFDDDN